MGSRTNGVDLLCDVAGEYRMRRRGRTDSNQREIVAECMRR
jgi:hypothetical protein